MYVVLGSGMDFFKINDFRIILVWGLFFLVGLGLGV